MGLKITNLKPRIGSLIEADRETLLSGAAAGEIRELLEQRGVLVMRGIDLNDDEQLAFTRTLGTVMEAGGMKIYKVTLDTKENPIYADYNLGNFSWHIDRTDTDVPPFCSMLNPRKLSPSGGQTEFSNTYAAYDDLPESDKKLLNGLKVVHKVARSFRITVPNPTEEQLTRWASHPDKVHPLVWTHRSGRMSLVLSTSGDHVIGMPKDESGALLTRLMAWATKPEYVYLHEWAMGDLVFWDNTGTMHKVRSYDPNCGRRLHRTTLVGEEPIAA